MEDPLGIGNSYLREVRVTAEESSMGDMATELFTWSSSDLKQINLAVSESSIQSIFHGILFFLFIEIAVTALFVIVINAERESFTVFALPKI